MPAIYKNTDYATLEAALAARAADTDPTGPITVAGTTAVSTSGSLTIDNAVEIVGGASGGTLNGLITVTASGTQFSAITFAASTRGAELVTVLADNVSITGSIFDGAGIASRAFVASNLGLSFTDNQVRGFVNGSYINGSVTGEISGNTISNSGNGFVVDSTGVDLSDNTFVEIARSNISISATESTTNLSDYFDAGNIFDGTGTQIAATRFDDATTIVGSDISDLIVNSGDATSAFSFDGRGGNDTVNSGLGDDTFAGGSGDDTAVYTGARADYEIVRNGNTIVVADTRADAPNGIDTLTSFETLRFSDGQVQTSTIADSNPVITSDGGGETATVSVAENSTVVTTVVAVDGDADAVITYEILGGADEELFEIDSVTGALSFTNAPNFEAPADAGSDNVYDVIVAATDGINTDTQAIAVTVTDVNDVAPVITSNGGGDAASVSVAENTTVVTTVTATDDDTPTADLRYAVSGADAALFTIDSVTGALSFTNAPNFEAPADAGANNVYDVIVTASDGTNSDTQAIAVTVTDVNDVAPVITSNGGAATANVSVAENATAVTTVTATDSDTPTADLRYSVSGTDAALFTIDSVTGALSFTNAPDFEAPADAGANNVYDVIVTASDGTNSDTQAVAVTVTDVVEGGGGGGGGGTPPVAPPIEGTAGADTITGVPGQNNVIAAGAGNDTVFAGSGNDTVNGNADDDAVNGGQGNDLVQGGQGNDLVQGGQGNDSVFGDNGNDRVFGDLGDDVVNGNAGNDTVNGGQGNDLVRGGQGDDVVSGGQGNDQLFGDLGNDVLNGDLGNDFLTGGAGSDVFQFSTSSGADVVTDFDFSQGDRLDLQGQSYVVGENNEGVATLFLSGGGTVVLLGYEPDQFQANFVVA